MRIIEFLTSWLTPAALALFSLPLILFLITRAKSIGTSGARGIGGTKKALKGFFSESEEAKKRRESLTSLAIIVVGIFLINLLCWMMGGRWPWWEALWSERSFFWTVMVALVFSIYAARASKKGSAVRRIAVAIMLSIVAAWTNLAMDAKKAERKPGQEVTQAPSSKGINSRMEPIPEPNMVVLKRDVPVKAKTWSNWERIKRGKMLVDPGLPGITYEVQTVDGSIYTVRLDGDGQKDWGNRALYQRYIAPEDTIYTLWGPKDQS